MAVPVRTHPQQHCRRRGAWGATPEDRVGKMHSLAAHPSPQPGNLLGHQSNRTKATVLWFERSQLQNPWGFYEFCWSNPYGIKLPEAAEECHELIYHDDTEGNSFKLAVLSEKNLKYMLQCTNFYWDEFLGTQEEMGGGVHRGGCTGNRGKNLNKFIVLHWWSLWLQCPDLLDKIPVNLMHCAYSSPKCIRGLKILVKYKVSIMWLF